jgi:hypothetical protein
MGRRSRRRGDEPVRAPLPARGVGGPSARPPRRHAKLDEAPKAPWHPFPLVELSILAGLVLIGVGIASDPGEPRTTLLFGGLALVSIASLELSIREHLAGYRSHTTLLAGAAALAVALPLWFTPVPQVAILVVAAAIGFAAFRALRSIFERKAEGLSWRA